MTHTLRYNRKKKFLEVIAILELIRRSYQEQMMDSERAVYEAARCNDLALIIRKVKTLKEMEE